MISKRALYAVHGSDKYLAEAARSARSLRAHSPDCEIFAYASQDCVSRLDESAFDQVIAVDLDVRSNVKIDFSIKLYAIEHGLVGDALFIDTDTYVCGDLDEAWALLDRFDILACHAPYRRRFRYENYNEPDFVSEVPTAFCEFNTGVIFLRENESTRSLIDHWTQLYEQAPLSGDQYLFMEAAYRSDCRIYVLPSEYNYRFLTPSFACDHVKIVHAHHPDLESIAAKLNTLDSPRVSMWRDDDLEMWAPPSRAPKPPQK